MREGGRKESPFSTFPFSPARFTLIPPLKGNLGTMSLFSFFFAVFLAHSFSILDSELKLELIYLLEVRPVLNFLHCICFLHTFKETRLSFPKALFLELVRQLNS